jgi:hypothetical protein
MSGSVSLLKSIKPSVSVRAHGPGWRAWQVEGSIVEHGKTPGRRHLNYIKLFHQS